MRQSRMNKPSRSSLRPISFLRTTQRRLEMARFGYLKSLFALACLLALAFTTDAQSPAPTPQVIAPTAAVTTPRVAGEATMYCAGYIRLEKLPQMPEIVGALEEQEQHSFA